RRKWPESKAPDLRKRSRTSSGVMRVAQVSRLKFQVCILETSGLRLTSEAASPQYTEPNRADYRLLIRHMASLSGSSLPMHSFSLRVPTVSAALAALLMPALASAQTAAPR